MPLLVIHSGLTERLDWAEALLLGYTFPRLLAQREEEEGTSAIYSCIPIGLWRQLRYLGRYEARGLLARGQVRPSWHMGEVDRDGLCNLNVFPQTSSLVLMAFLFSSCWIWMQTASSAYDCRFEVFSVHLIEDFCLLVYVG